MEFNGIFPLVMTFTVCHGKIHHAIKFGKPSISISGPNHLFLWEHGPFIEVYYLAKNLSFPMASPVNVITRR